MAPATPSASRILRAPVGADDDGPRKAQLGFAGTLKQCRDRGGHMAVLHRGLEDLAATRASEIFAITQESLDFPAVDLSAGARNLLRAGFRLRDVRTLWQPPEELLDPREPDEDEDEDGWDDGGGGGQDDDRGPDEDHDFVLRE